MAKTQIEILTESVMDFREQNKGLLKEMGEAKVEVIRITKEYEEKVADINKELAAKDATLKQIQDTVLELQAKQGRIWTAAGGQGVQTVNDLISKALEDNAAIVKAGRIGTEFWTGKVEKGAKWISKAAGTITLAANVTGASISGVPTWSNEIAARGYATTHLRDILQVVDTATGIFAFFRANIPAGEGSFGFTAPGGTKNPVDKDLTLVTVTASYLNGYADIAKESLQDIPMLQSYLNEELVQDYLSRETFELGGQLVTGAGGPTTASGANVIEKLIYVIAAQRQLKYGPDFMLVRPAKWAEIMVTKPNDYSLPNAVIITPQGTVAVVGLPLYVTAENMMDDAHALVGESRRAKIMQVVGEGLRMELFQQHDKAVYQNLLTMRVEARVALILFRLNAFSYQAI